MVKKLLTKIKILNIQDNLYKKVESYRDHLGKECYAVERAEITKAFDDLINQV